MMNQTPLLKLDKFNHHPNAENTFNKINILYRLCYKFAPKSNEDEDICFCNRKKSDHHPKEQATTGAKWEMLYNTSQETNPAHGILSNGALFAQLALDTPEAKVERILFDVWQITQPRLLVSIIGGAKYFNMSDRLETNFINGIIDVTLKSDAWLITNGFNAGIVQLVGQAMNKVKLTKPKKQITAIGLCTWGSVKGLENIRDQQNIDKQKKIMERKNDQRDLEMNHSHYLMLDDGTLGRYDTVDYRTRLCVQVAKLQHENDFLTPAITIVVEGGRDTITNMYYDLRADIPVLIIDGSGRVADFFKRWLLYTKEFDDASEASEYPYEIDEIDKVTAVDTLPSITSNPHGIVLVQLRLDKSRITLPGKFEKYLKQLRRELDNILSDNGDSKEENTEKQPATDASPVIIDHILAEVLYCLQPAVRSGIAVFDLNSENNLSEAIFRSICKSRQRHFERKENDQNAESEKNERRSKPPLTSHTKERQTKARRNVYKKDRNAQRSQLLQLSMDWNCVDVAKELILQNSLDNILDQEHAFLYALEKDLPAFVYEFLKLGFDPSVIFFPNEEFCKGKMRYTRFLQRLYKTDAVNSPETHLSSFIEFDTARSGKIIERADDLNHMLFALTGTYMQKLYFDSQEEENLYRKLQGMETVPEGSSVGIHVSGSEDYLAHEQNPLTIRDYIMRDLFLWSILMNHIEMAKVFLSHQKYRICAGLIATKILKEYHRKAFYGELKQSYLKNASYFEDYAVGCINECEMNDADQACQIVLQQIELYGNVTCLQVASNANDKLFIATSSCVQAINNTWFDKIHPGQGRKRDGLASVFAVFSFGLLAPFIITYRKVIEKPKDELFTKSLQSYGIDYSDPYSLVYPHFCKIPSINNYLLCLKNFYRAPRTKYCYHCITYCFFLLLFSYVLLFEFQRPSDDTPSIHWTEILTIILVSFMLIEEINNFVSLASWSVRRKLISYFRNLFKILNLLGFILFYIGLILRFAYADTEDQFVAARVIMALDLEIWWLRSLSFIIVIPFLGPHLVAIGKMLKDLFFFMCIIVIVMTGYGVASRSMVYYPNADKFNESNINTAFDGRSIFRQIAYPVYYLLYGEFGNELTNLDQYPDAGWSIATHVLLAIHMLFVNILLTNLLIAMFSKRFEQVYEDTQNIWHSQKYIFTREYYTRSPYFPPLSFVHDIYRLCLIPFFAIKGNYMKKTSDRRAEIFKMIAINKNMIRDWQEFEGASTYEYAHRQVKETKVTSTISTNKSDTYEKEKQEEINDTANDSNKSAGDMREIRNDLDGLKQALEGIKELIEAQKKSG